MQNVAKEEEDVISSKSRVQIYNRQKYTALNMTFPIFNNHLQKLQHLPKNINGKRSNRGIWQKSVRGLYF